MLTFLIFPLTSSPNNIITSAVAADLASHPSVQGNNKSLGTVTGLINGTGSITASIGLLAIGPLQTKYGWGSVWMYLIGCTTTGTLLMSTKIYAELFPPTSTSNGIVV
jgi:MFS transporter, OPA family, solute carrier family 37 (glycerol-3-phosphate transporter), member 1/2